MAGDKIQAGLAEQSPKTLVDNHPQVRNLSLNQPTAQKQQQQQQKPNPKQKNHKSCMEPDQTGMLCNSVLKGVACPV